uniref:histidinol dehydrogenase n=3 Tax=Flavobacterium sp. TaxID=239 RepID=UPI00404A855F
MKKLTFPPKSDWQKLTVRPTIDFSELNNTVLDVFENVKQNGDEALRNLTFLYDQVSIDNLKVSETTINQAADFLSEDLKKAMLLAKSNIETFHASQKEVVQIIETTKGVTCWRESRPIEKVGLYIPGGSAPLFSTVLMLGIPAQIAGCQEIVLCTPPDKSGQINPAILFAAQLVGINQIFKIGGSQAIAAMTFGTETIPKVNKIFGPGNQFVTAAKQMAQNYGVAIDMPAGPSELLIIADKTANPEFVAADLLSQAEHGADSQVILLSDNEATIEAALNTVNAQIKSLPRKEIAQKALANSRAILLENLDACVAFSNQYAPEHLILAVENYHEFKNKILSAGSVFLGNYSSESAGDYASGTNHTLPTNGFARNYSGVSLDSFIKKITFQEISKIGLQNIGPVIEQMATAEQLIAHKNAISIRLKSLENE